MSVWMAAYHCTMGMEKRKSPKRKPIENPEGLESELCASLFQQDAIQVSWKVSPNGPAGIFRTRVHTPPGWLVLIESA